jgi:hypothetical protein
MTRSPYLLLLYNTQRRSRYRITCTDSVLTDATQLSIRMHLFMLLHFPAKFQSGVPHKVCQTSVCHFEALWLKKCYINTCPTVNCHIVVLVFQDTVLHCMITAYHGARRSHNGKRNYQKVRTFSSETRRMVKVILNGNQCGIVENLLALI